MSVHDIYVIAPYIGMAGAGILVILLDMVFRRKDILPVAAFIGLLVPFGFSLLQAFDLGNQLDLVQGSNPLDAGEASILAGSLSVDRFALFFNFLVLAATGLVVLSSGDYVKRMERFEGEYYGLVLLSASGMMLLAAATELVTIYISLELATMPLAALAAFMMTRQSSEAGMKFLIIGAISSAVMLYGMAMIYGYTGSTKLEEIAAGVAGTSGEIPFGNMLLLSGVTLMIAGFGFKISSAPFHMWAPDVYEGAPTPVVAFLSVASKAAAFAIMLRVLFVGFFDVSLDWGALLAVLAAASMIVGNLVAISQTNIRRLFGYSTVAHAGYILVGVAAGVTASGTTPDFPEFAALGPDSVLFYLAAYAAANLTAFIAIIAIGSRIGSDQIDDYAGVAQRSPALAIALALALIALIGVPPTGIFIAKLYIFTAAVDADLVWLAVVGVINSVVSAYYYVRIVRVMFLQQPKSGERITAPPASWAALGVACAAMLFMGIAPGYVLDLSQIAIGPLTP